MAVISIPRSFNIAGRSASRGLSSFARGNHYYISPLYPSIGIRIDRNSRQLYRFSRSPTNYRPTRAFLDLAIATNRTIRSKFAREIDRDRFSLCERISNNVAKSVEGRRKKRRDGTEYLPGTVRYVFFTVYVLGLCPCTLSRTIGTNGRTNGFFLPVHLIQPLREIVHSFAFITRSEHGPLNERHRAH